MSHCLYATIRAIVRQELAGVRGAALAVVQEQHPHAADGDLDNYACTVVLRDTGLVLQRVPVATARIGVAALPAVGDLVLVEFVGGDLNAPVVVGSLYNDEDRPPVNDDGKAVVHLPLAAADSDAVHAELESGDARRLTLRLGAACELILQDDDPVVTLEVDGGKATVSIERDGAVTVASNGELALSGGTVKIEGQQIDVEASGPLNLKGATVNLN